jgi:hypothetical protein
MKQSFLLAVALQVLALPTSEAANLVVGGGFESPSAPTASFILSVTPDGWSGLGDIVAQGYGGSVNSGDGLQWLDLNPGMEAGTGISQTVLLTKNTPYLFSFRYDGGEPIVGFTTAIDFSIASATDLFVSDSVSTADMNVYAGAAWATYSRNFLASTDTTAILRFQPNGVWAGGFIDAVSIAAVPELNSAYLLLLGLAIVACLRLVKTTCAFSRDNNYQLQ